MSTLFWRQGGPEHLELAHRLFISTCDLGFVPEQLRAEWWEDDDTRAEYIEIAWVAVNAVHDIHQQMKAKPEPTPLFVPPLYVKNVPPCKDGVHDFFMVEDTNILACHVCPWWEPQS